MSYYKKVGDKLYGPYSYERPTHHWNEKDLARIAKIVAARKGANGAVIVLAAIASALGLGVVICKAARTVRSYLSIITWLKELSALLAVSQLVSVILTFLLKAKTIAPPWLQLLLAVAVAAFMVIDKIFSVIPTITGDMAIAHDISVTLDDWCRAVDEYAGEQFEAICDATGSACEEAKQAAKDAEFAMKTDVEKAIEVLGQERYWDWWNWVW